jgi:hypothetical protein
MYKPDEMEGLTTLLKLLKLHKVSEFSGLGFTVKLSPLAFVDLTPGAGHNGSISDIPPEETEEEILYHSVR